MKVCTRLALATFLQLAACGGSDTPPVPRSPDGGGVDARVDAAVDPRDGAPDAPPDAAADATPDATPPDAAPDATPDAPPAPSCPAWESDVDTIFPEGAQVLATVEGGALVLGSFGDGEGSCHSAINQAPCDRVKVFQRSLHGDFDVSVGAEISDGGSHFAGPTLFLALDHSFSTSYQTAILGGDSTPGKLFIDARAGGVEDEQAQPVSTTQATLRARRVGGQLTLSGAAGGQTINKVIDGVTADLVVGISLSDGFSPDLIIAKMTDFKVVGGGGSVVSDDFACTRSIAH